MITTSIPSQNGTMYVEYWEDLVAPLCYCISLWGISTTEEMGEIHTYLHYTRPGFYTVS